MERSENQQIEQDILNIITFGDGPGTDIIRDFLTNDELAPREVEAIQRFGTQIDFDNLIAVAWERADETFQNMNPGDGYSFNEIFYAQFVANLRMNLFHGKSNSNIQFE